MKKYRIMVIDDRIRENKDILTDFFTNSVIDGNGKLTENQKEAYKKELKIEFDIIYPETDELLDNFINVNRVDAYMLDVIYDQNGWMCDLKDILGYIRVHNASAPIFVYSKDWMDKDILDTCSYAFRNVLPGRTASYYYNFKTIALDVAKCKDGDVKGRVRLKHERQFIRKTIASHQKRTIKDPFSPVEDIAILHISDIQYGDDNTTDYTASLWKEVVSKCRELEADKTIYGIDLLAITGDISMHGIESEMEIAREDLESLCKELWEKESIDGSYRERILLVPGNHDYDLNCCLMDYYVAENKEKERRLDFQKASEELAKAERIGNGKRNYHCDGFGAFGRMAYRLTGNDVFLEERYMNYIEDRFKDWDLRIICLNTADGICAERTNGIGIDDQVFKDKIIRGRGGQDKLYTIILSHHSPTYLQEMEGLDQEDKEEKKQFEVKCNSVIQSFGAKLWLGGHRHLHTIKMNTSTSVACTVMEAATVRLEEKWKDEKSYTVETDAGPIVSHRGFQIIHLKKKENGFQAKAIKFVFDDNGVAHKVL